MYDNIMISSFGSNIYNTIGFLDSVKERTNDCVIWNSVGSASLILFFKILGFNFHQMIHQLKDFNICHTFINSFSLIPENETEKKEFIEDWLISKINQVSLINTETTLKEIYRLTNLFPNFIVFSCSEKKIVSLNPSSTPDYNLIDCVMASLPCVGTYLTHQINTEVYSNLNAINSLPTDHVFKTGKEKGFFYLGNISFFVDQLEELAPSPLLKYEKEIINQFLERNKMLLTENEDVVVLYSDIFRELDNIKMDNLCKSGFLQGKNFLEGIDTNQTFMDHKNSIYNQD